MSNSDAAEVRIGETRVGKGVFARRSYPICAAIGEITGEIIDDATYVSEYCFDIGDGLQLDPAAPFRFLNHSCEPNCEFDYFIDSEQLDDRHRMRVFLFALRNIHPGEELTIDYNWSATDAIPCRCQAPSCRGWVVGLNSMHELENQ